MLQLHSLLYICFMHITLLGTGKNRKTHTHHRSSKSRLNFLDMKFPIAQFDNGRIPKGQHEFRFQFAIPHGVPPSWFVGRKGSDCCSISYEVCGFLHRTGGMKWRVENKVYFDVYVPAPTLSSQPAVLHPKAEPVNAFCCYGRGHIGIGAIGDSQVLVGGTSTKIKYSVQNFSSAKVKALEIKLIENIRWHSGGHSGRKQISLFEKRLKVDCKDREDGNALNINVNPLSKQEKIELGDNEDGVWLRKVKSILDRGLYSIDGLVSDGAHGTYAGKILSVKHTLVVRVITTVGTNNPELTHDMFVYMKPPSEGPTRERVSGASFIDSVSAVPLSEWQATDWASVSAAVAVTIPSVPYVEAQVIDGDIHADFAFDPSPDGPPPFDFGRGFDALVGDGLRKAYDQTGLFRAWLGEGTESTNSSMKIIETLSAQQYGALFNAIRSPSDQLVIADLVGSHIHSIACSHIAEAALACPLAIRGSVVKSLLRSAGVHDKQNANLVKDVMDSFDFLYIEDKFK